MDDEAKAEAEAKAEEGEQAADGVSSSHELRTHGPGGRLRIEFQRGRLQFRQLFLAAFPAGARAQLGCRHLPAVALQSRERLGPGFGGVG